MVPAVAEALWSAVLLAGIGLGLYCLLTIHRSPYLGEVQKLKWLLFTLALPYVGPIAWIFRSRAEKQAASERGERDGAP